MITFINRQTHTHTQHWRCNFKRTKCEQLQKKIQETSDFDDDNDDDDDNLDDDDNSRFFSNRYIVIITHTTNLYMQNNLKKTTIKPTTTTPLQSKNIGDKFWNDLYLCMDTMFALLFGTTITTTTMKTWPNPKSNFCCFSLFYLTPPPPSTIEKKNCTYGYREHKFFLQQQH